VYGQPDKLPVDENSPLKKPESPYGNTKQVSEQILNDAALASKLNVISLRYFNPVGAHESALIGEYPLGTPSNLMPILTQTAIGKRDSFNVFGNDYDTPDGTCIRDYIHVTDLSIAHVVAIDRLMNQKNESQFEVFNLGTGTGVSVLEIINSFERVNKVKLNYKVTGRRHGDVEKVWADTSLANNKLGWKAERNLDQMVASAWAWEKMLHEYEKKHVNQ
jgi:UDP-glucose 4-epimerase